MNEIEIKIAVLSLWREMANTPDEAVDGVAADFKNNILESLGYPRMLNGCPYCQAYLNYEKDPQCGNCPIALDTGMDFGCENFTPYEAYYEEFETGYHIQEVAEDFYNYLVDLYERR